ncbi:hypothetical protein [Pseudonocardia parietis]|uniref:Uncharacterized protein n=1 Tax=Pseudonocardia parietis TaxID=570936 RepID=A0ABS4W6S4_9PSEU|nr:hypothetical protein [Pseudonocardia parietis]MBP2371909.1 hypothetical protein [Pseudonocardia parietis]
MTTQHPARTLSWPLILGMSALALLWPLSGLTGIGGTGAPRAFVIIGITLAVWIGVVGFGRLPRPVLTLVLTGLGYGLVSHLLGVALGGITLDWTLVPGLLMNILWGLIAGAIAAAVQRARGR